MPEQIKPSGTEWDKAEELFDWERQMFDIMRGFPREGFGDDARVQDSYLVYCGTDAIGSGTDGNVDTNLLGRQVTTWRLVYEMKANVRIGPSGEAPDAESFTVEGEGMLNYYWEWLFVRPGYPTRVLLSIGAAMTEGFFAGRPQWDDERRDGLRRELHELFQGAIREPVPMHAQPVADPEDLPEGELLGDAIDIQELVTERLQKVAEELAGGAVRVGLSTFTVEVDEDEDDAPAPRPETEEHDPTPFQGNPPMAGLLSDDFTSKTTCALMGADGRPAPTYEGEWGKDGTGHPIRVEQLGNPYTGRAIFKVQAYGEPDPAALEASMGWKMLDRMDMDTVWLNLLLLSYASATHRRGERPTIKIERRVVERVFGFRSRNNTVKKRAEEIKKHVEALQSVFVQLQNVHRHGDKLHFKGDMTAAPLWNLRMVAEGETDLFTGETVADWHLEAREGLWATEFLHNHGDQWTPLLKEWFAKIDRRGSKNYAQRLAVHLLFQFRINAKNGNRVRRSAQKLLEMCGEDMSQPRDRWRRTELKRCLSTALDTLERDYGIRVHADRVHMEKTNGMSFNSWKARVAAFDPPASMDGRLFQNAEGQPSSLPEVTGDWKPRQIRRLRTELIGETQSELGDRLGVSKQYVSQLERGTSNPSNRVCKILDALQARHE